MPSDGNGRQLPTLALVGQLGLTMVGSILLGCLIGRLLDGWLGSDPIFMIVLILAGVLGGMFAVYRTVSRFVDGNGRSDEDAAT